MFKKVSLSMLLLSAALLSNVVFAQKIEEPKQTAEAFLASIKFQQGNIKLPNGIATLNLPETFRYLSPEDADKILVQAWGNPPGTKTLGMLVPTDTSPISDNGWGVIITYDDSGHVKDDEADSINYDELLKDMKEATTAANEERKKAGYGELNLVGWAERPSYDKQTHKYFWARELSSGQSENTLNYSIRVLGRQGVLVLNAVAGMKQIATIKQEMKSVVTFTDFVEGNRYTDFNESTDRVAEYGLAALVAGGVAAKLGFFGKILAFLLAFKKFLFVGAIALFAGFAKLFKKKEAS